MRFLIGEPPEGAQEREQQERVLGIDAGRPAATGGQCGNGRLVRQVNGELTQREQVQSPDEGEGVHMQRPRRAAVI
jgi:hypothetical protein